MEERSTGYFALISCLRLSRDGADFQIQIFVFFIPLYRFFKGRILLFDFRVRLKSVERKMSRFSAVGPGVFSFRVIVLKIALDVKFT